MLAELKKNSVGQTFNSYCYNGKLLALPIDAATPASSWRPDLLEYAGVDAPAPWAQAVALARRNLAIIPAFNADLFLHFIMLVKALGAEPCVDLEKIAPREVMRQAVDMLCELTAVNAARYFRHESDSSRRAHDRRRMILDGTRSATHTTTMRVPALHQKQLRFGVTFNFAQTWRSAFAQRAWWHGHCCFHELQKRRCGARLRAVPSPTATCKK